MLRKLPNAVCAGPDPYAARGKLGRREFLRAGLTGFTTMSLAELCHRRALAANPSKKEKTAVILVWLRGGCSHLDTFDPKPDAPTEYRGPYTPLATNVPGIHLTELLPRLSTIADKYALLRSIAHGGGGHPAGSLRVLGGDPANQDKLKPVYPDWMSIVSYLRRDPTRRIPNYVAVNPVDRYDSFTIAGPTYLGPAYAPFKVTGNPNQPNFEVPNISMKPDQVDRFQQRVQLKTSFERLRSAIDATGTMKAVDAYEAQAIRMLTQAEAHDAFDLTKESDQVRERYGRNQWGQQCLMARRLVEAGVDVVATEFDGPLCGRVANWDDHAVNHHVFQAIKHRAP
ncbi:MAG: DUF1501 domain-containing protein, partial [Pirellulaceae bacterium]